jgi:hypothetical protein
MQNAVDSLKEKGYAATVEYPGYISVDGLAFGDNNPTWSWNSSTGEFSGDSRIVVDPENAEPGDGLPTPANITEWIITVLTKNRDARTAVAIEKADTALWDAVVKVFPEAKHGDLSPIRTHQLTEGLRQAIIEWVENNVPRICVTCGAEFDPDCGKTLGCEHCDGEFCSSDCLDKHWNESA